MSKLVIEISKTIQSPEGITSILNNLRKNGYTIENHTIISTWPDMQLGTEFYYKENCYIFISKVTIDKAKCILKSNLLNNDVIEPVYFDMIRTKDFIFK